MLETTPSAALIPIPNIASFIQKDSRFYLILIPPILRHILQGKRDVDQILDDLVGEDIIPELRPCNAHPAWMTCACCEDQLNMEMIVKHLTEYLLNKLTLSPDFLSGVSAETVRSGTYEVECQLYDPNTLVLVFLE